MLPPMSTLFFDRAGPLLKWGSGMFRIQDLNPEMDVNWSMTRWELFRLGLRCLWASVRN